MHASRLGVVQHTTRGTTTLLYADPSTALAVASRQSANFLVLPVALRLLPPARSSPAAHVPCWT